VGPRAGLDGRKISPSPGFETEKYGQKRTNNLCCADSEALHNLKRKANINEYLLWINFVVQ